MLDCQDTINSISASLVIVYGKRTDLAINYDKSHIYGIDRVLAVRRGTSRLGGKGQCFTCMICGQKRNLWLEQGKWFVEAYCSVPESRAS